MKRARDVEAPPRKRMMMAAPAVADMGQAPTNAFREIPRYVQYTSPAVSTIPASDGRPRAATALPLNLVALIVSYLDDIGDLARVCRTSRLMYYMTLPQLYQSVNLHSYGEMRYVNGRPEGFGSGSPFMMALNGLVTKGHAALVRDFRVWGEWKETGIDDFAKGRVPCNSMMLNILLRAATDKMTKLESFCWELNCKPLKTLYQGLGAHNTLTSFTLRFPSTRVPRPSVLIPPMLNLRVFRAMDVDPMCYPDDISMLMLHSKKLEDVRLHFSPRMRAEAESIMNLNLFFGRCHKAGYKLKVKHFALQNWFGPNVLGFDQIFEVESCKSITFIDTFGGNDPRTVFVDDTWKDIPADAMTAFECVRCNEISPSHIEIMRKAKVQMKEFYIISNAKRPKTGFTPVNGASSTPITPSVDTPHDENASPEWITLGKDYLHAISRFHGEALRHLLLSDLWAITKDEMADLVRHCPNLEQLGMAIDSVDHESIRLLMPFLPKLKILRVLNNEQLQQHLRTWSHEERMWRMGLDLSRRSPLCLEFVCMADFCYKLGRNVEMMKEDGTIERRYEMSMVDKKEAMKYEIWKLDALDISVDPVAPFNP
ncbi:hypothetical protein AC579_835 [Pseudocercospora musae]|uniref:F-box domain-containing protein n=1 Tax=Pseudocercospora musae TaxID=113226 RepID=A0A139I8Y4_9PEZI|nr:hypothetical protein AC579_835 [Pseudocercospora musae]